MGELEDSILLQVDTFGTLIRFALGICRFTDCLRTSKRADGDRGDGSRKITDMDPVWSEVEY